MDENVPLIVPEVNRDDLNDETLIANPNCSTIQSVVALKPLQKFGIKRITYTTYQAVSGSGVGGIEDLKTGRRIRIHITFNKVFYHTLMYF